MFWKTLVAFYQGIKIIPININFGTKYHKSLQEKENSKYKVYNRGFVTECKKHPENQQLSVKLWNIRNPFSSAYDAP